MRLFIRRSPSAFPCFCPTALILWVIINAVSGHCQVQKTLQEKRSTLLFCIFLPGPLTLSFFKGYSERHCLMLLFVLCSLQGPVLVQNKVDWTEMRSTIVDKRPVLCLSSFFSKAKISTFCRVLFITISWAACYSIHFKKERRELRQA